MGYGVWLEVSLIYDTRAPIFSHKSLKLGAVCPLALGSNFLVILCSEPNHYMYFSTALILSCFMLFGFMDYGYYFLSCSQKSEPQLESVTL